MTVSLFKHVLFKFKKVITIFKYLVRVERYIYMYLARLRKLFVILEKSFET